jgi:glycine cleavage system protein P-like pyridoxal-binding family
LLKRKTGFDFALQGKDSIGRVKAFYGNFLVIVKALTLYRDARTGRNPGSGEERGC